MKATKIGARWQFVDGDDLVTCWLDADGFHSQRIAGYKTESPRGHDQTNVSFGKLIPAAEGQKEIFTTSE